MRKVIFFTPLIVATILAVLGAVWWNINIQAPSNSEERIRFVITQGSSAEKIGRDLSEAGLVRSAFAFKVYTQLNNLTKKIPPGEFMVPQNLNIEELISYLSEGPQEFWVTLPEGLRREEMPDRFIEAFGLEGQDAIDFRNTFLSESRFIEGYLFPDSYLFPPDIRAETVVARLRNTFEDKTKGEFSQKLDESEITLEQAVVLASIIERETLTSAERPIVAGILFNRMDIDMPLQTDATVQYAVANKRCKAKSICDWWVLPTKADLDINSPYNTYLNNGLPPAPIANPGITSLMAVVDPEPSSYFYYIHAEDGQIHYGSTLSEHNANVSKYLR